MFDLVVMIIIACGGLATNGCSISVTNQPKLVCERAKESVEHSSPWIEVNCISARME
jgi:hypothetical protein